MKTSAETWKDIPGFKGLYEISNFGNIKSLNYKNTKREEIVKPYINDHGYYCIYLYNNGVKRKIKIHQYVAIVFLGHIPCGHTKVINHKDFNKLNNHVDNLEITTARENSNKKHLKSTSKYTGVCLDKRTGRWHANIYVGRTKSFLGSFKEEIDASNAYEKALKLLKL